MSYKGYRASRETRRRNSEAHKKENVKMSKLCFYYNKDNKFFYNKNGDLINIFQFVKKNLNLHLSNSIQMKKPQIMNHSQKLIKAEAMQFTCRETD